MIASASLQQVPISGADTAWVMASTALVLLMTPALGFFYGGLVRGKNVLNTLMMSFAALGVVGVLWALLGYSLASPCMSITGIAIVIGRTPESFDGESCAVTSSRVMSPDSTTRSATGRPLASSRAT